MQIELRIEPSIISAGQPLASCRPTVSESSESGMSIYRVSAQVPAATVIDQVRLFELELPAKVQVYRQGFFMPSDLAGFFSLAAGETVPDHGRWIRENDDHVFMSHTLIAIDVGQGERILVGFTSFDRFEGIFNVDTRGGSIRLSAWNACEDVTADGSVAFEEFVVLRGSDLTSMLDRYAAFVATRCRPRVPTETVAGWIDWQFYREEKDERCVLASLEPLAFLRRQGYPFKYVIIDGGWCDFASEWLQRSAKFPSGMGWLGEKVRAAGLELGIWFAPYITNERTSVVQEHPDFLMRLKGSEKPIHKPGSNVGPCHVIDFTVPGALEWLRGIVRTMVRDWKVKYIKLDGPCLAHYAGGRLHDPSATTTSMVRDTLRVMREECGEEVLLEGEGIYGPSIGFVDVQRVSQDYFPFWHHPDTGVPVLGRNLKKELSSSFMHGVWWHNHRENIVLRDFLSPFHARSTAKPGTKDQMLSAQEIETEMTAATMAGGAMLLSDPMEEYVRSRTCMAMSSRILPQFPLHARPLDESWLDEPSCHVAKITRDFEEWYVVSVINWEDRHKNFQVPLPFASRGEWHAFEFWGQEYLGACCGSIEVKDVAAHGCRMLALRRKTGRPQLVGTGMHLLQGAVEIKSVTVGETEIRIRVAHVAQKDAAVFIWLPADCVIDCVEADNSPIGVDARSGSLVKVIFDNPGATEIRLRWVPHGR